MPSGVRDTEPWSPYPVQDWSSLPAPADGLATSAVSADWAPPRDPRPWWLPLLVIGLVAALVAASFYLADSAGTREPRTAARGFVPADGAAANHRRDVVRGGTTVTAPFVTESARFTGRSVGGVVDGALGIKVWGALGSGDVARMRFWRTSTTEIGSVTSSQQLVRLYRVDGPVELVAESGPGRVHAYRPALVELPADVRPGSTWSGKGAAGDTLTYRSQLRAESAAGGCLQVSGMIAYSATSGQPGETTEVRKTWCPGAGLVEATEVTGDVTSIEAPEPRPAPDPQLRTVTEQWVWSDPARWRKRTFDAMSIDANLGEGIMTGVPGASSPVVPASGLVIRPTSSDDLVAFTPKTQTSWTSLWRMHPGGAVLSLAAFGDVVVVTTGRRQVVGYTDGGIRLWEVDLDDLAFHRPIQVSDTEIAVVDAAGRLRVLEILTGRVRWERNVGAEVFAAPVGDTRAIVIMDGSGTTSAWQPATGERLWVRDLDGRRGVLVDDTVVVHNRSTLEAVSLHSGEHRWLRPVRGAVNDLRAFGDRTVLATALGTSIIDRHGDVVARRGSYDVTTVQGDYLIGWGAQQAEVMDRDLGPVTTFEITPKTGSTQRLPAAYRQGVYLFGIAWPFEAWSDEP